MNILTSLQKEIDKGNKYITHLGALITPEKIEAMARTEYLKQVKDGKCDNITFDKFLDNYTDENFTETYEIFIYISEIICTKTTDTNADIPTETAKKVDTTPVKPEDKKETKPNSPTPNKSKYTWI